MKCKAILRIFFLLLFLLAGNTASALEIPKPEGWVNDFAGVITPEYKEKLNSLITELEQKNKFGDRGCND